ncbi:MAG: hypothetical protein V4736_03515 [Bdellovibrionota bacterium]
MKQEVLTQFPWPVLPTAALLLFFIFFLSLLFILSTQGYKELAKANSRIPLDDGDYHER